MSDNNNFKRIQFDFSKEAFERLESLVKLSDATSKVEVIRNALRVYEFIVRNRKEGSEFFLKKNGDDTEAIILI